MNSDPRKWMVIHDVILDRIRNGILAIGDHISIGELAIEFRAARPTVSQALTVLDAEGYVRRYPGHGWQVTPKREEVKLINVGCTHYHNPHYHGHCSEMQCRNYINKCPRHQITGSDTATCNLERAKYLVGMSQETKDLAVNIISLSPAMEESILLLVELVARDSEENAAL